MRAHDAWCWLVDMREVLASVATPALGASAPRSLQFDVLLCPEVKVHVVRISSWVGLRLHFVCWGPKTTPNCSWPSSALLATLLARNGRSAQCVVPCQPDTRPRVSATCDVLIARKEGSHHSRVHVRLVHDGVQLLLLPWSSTCRVTASGATVCSVCHRRQCRSYFSSRGAGARRKRARRTPRLALCRPPPAKSLRGVHLHERRLKLMVAGQAVRGWQLGGRAGTDVLMTWQRMHTRVVCCELVVT